MRDPQLLSPGRSLGRLVLDARVDPGAIALEVEGAALSYGELRTRAGKIARILLEGRAASSPRLGAVLATRSAPDYVGVLGTLLAGSGYVPLNAKFPAERSAQMLAASRATTLVASSRAADTLRALLVAVPQRLLVVLPDAADVAELASTFPQHAFVGAEAVEAVDPLEEAPAVDEAAIAYLMFTSGTTGTPKGVMVTHANVLHHLDVMARRYQVVPGDRFSHAFDLTFDLSVFDLFLPWSCGASVHVIPPSEQMAPARFVREHALTVWFSVPSVAMMLRGLRLLKPGSLPSLRLSLFCGERLTPDVARAWADAAPQSVLENLYGPTEATIACTLYRWDSGLSPAASTGGSVPIGRPYDGHAAAIVDPSTLALVEAGEAGELCIRGPQVATGYLDDAARTAERFVSMPWDAGTENRWYRTGDIARVDVRGDLVHLGRNDDQVKLRGFRVELGEIEARLREVAGTDFAGVVAWPPLAPTHVVAFVARSAVAAADILSGIARVLPEYMVPKDVRVLGEMPLNANGKMDKGALRRLLEDADGNT